MMRYGPDGKPLYHSHWIIDCGVEVDYWLQALTDWDRGDYGTMDAEIAYWTLDDSLVPQFPIRMYDKPQVKRAGRVRLYRVK